MKVPAEGMISSRVNTMTGMTTLEFAAAAKSSTVRITNMVGKETNIKYVYQRMTQPRFAVPTSLMIDMIKSVKIDDARSD
jgi:hypothetical protein